MVSTRHHPRPFPEPTLPPSRSPNGSSPTPSKEAPATPAAETGSSKRRSTSTRRKSTAATATATSPASPNGPSATPSKSSSSLTRTRSARRSRSSRTHFIHTPTPLALGWLFISLPLVIWDTLYVFLRPHSMPGGKLAWPLWEPYALYASVDYVYGFPAWDRHDGFTAAQASLNAIETASYLYYLYVIGREAEGGWSGIFESMTDAIRGKRVEERGDVRIWGKGVELAVLLCFSSYVMTLSKTILYWLNEAFSNFANIGHNSPATLFFYWIVPNGAWIVLPTLMIKHLGHEILDGLRGYKED